MIKPTKTFQNMWDQDHLKLLAAPWYLQQRRERAPRLLEWMGGTCMRIIQRLEAPFIVKRAESAWGKSIFFLPPSFSKHFFKTKRNNSRRRGWSKQFEHAFQMGMTQTIPSYKQTKTLVPFGIFSQIRTWRVMDLLGPAGVGQLALRGCSRKPPLHMAHDSSLRFFEAKQYFFLELRALRLEARLGCGYLKVFFEVKPWCLRLGGRAWPLGW